MRGFMGECSGGRMGPESPGGRSRGRFDSYCITGRFFGADAKRRHLGGNPRARGTRPPVLNPTKRTDKVQARWMFILLATIMSLLGRGTEAQKPADLWSRAGLPPARGWAAKVLDAMATLEAPVPEAGSQAQARACLSRWVVSPRLCLVQAAEGQPASVVCDLLKHSGWKVDRETNNSRTVEPGLQAFAAGAALWIGLEIGEATLQAPGPVAPGFSPPFNGVIQPVRLRVVRTEDGSVLLADSWKAQGEGVTAQAAEQAMLAHIAEILKGKVGILAAKAPPEPVVVFLCIQKAEPDSPIDLDWLSQVPGGAKRVSLEPSQTGTLSVSLPDGPGALLVAAAKEGSFRAASLEPLALAGKVQAGSASPPQKREGPATAP
jgi:hypothetical protein